MVANIKPVVWMNGKYIDYDSAKVSVEDRGFQFGDGVYEVIRAIKGRYFRLEQHLNRLHHSLNAVEISSPLNDNEFRRLSEDMLSRVDSDDVTLYVQITRGATSRTHLFPLGLKPTVVLILRPLKRMPEDSYLNGLQAILLKDDRWLRCDIKSTALLANVLAKDRARKAKADDAILSRDGLITEGTASNIFAVCNGELATPKADHRILNGITRQCVLEIARAKGMKVSERDISVIELKEAQEVFLTSTTMGVAPVVGIDHLPVRSGTVGPVTKSLMEEYFKILFQR